MTALKVILMVIALSEFVEPAKILGIFTVNSKEHYYLGNALMKELASRGHEVTVVSPYHHESRCENCTSVDIGYEYLYLPLGLDYLRGSCLLSDIPYIHERTIKLTETVLALDAFQKVLKSDQSFDIVIIEYAMNEALLGIGKMFNAPVVLFSPYSSASLMNHLFANPAPASFVPNIFTAYTGSMGYWERTANMMYYHFDNLYRRLYSLPKQRQLAKSYINEDIDFDEVMYNVALVLLNSHPAVSVPVPKSPNMIEIAGFHIKHSDTLPKDVKEFLDSATDGLIVITEIVELDYVPMHWRLYFENIPQKVLILGDEYEDTWDHDFPSNVKFVKTLSLSSLLDHKNTKLLVCHGNYLHMIEAVDAGIPIIVIASEIDQNIAFAVRNGYAFFLPSDQMDAALEVAQLVVLNNDWYKNNVKRHSRILRDQIVKPMDTAVFWIEYVIRNQGANELKSPGVYLNWYQRSMLDIIIVLVIIDVILFLIFYYIFKHIIRMLRKKFKSRKTENYNKLIE